MVVFSLQLIPTNHGIIVGKNHKGYERKAREATGDVTECAKRNGKQAQESRHMANNTKLNILRITTRIKTEGLHVCLGPVCLFST